MVRVLNLRNILELVNDGLNDRSFAQQRFIGKRYEVILHVFTQATDELKALLAY